MAALPEEPLEPRRAVGVHDARDTGPVRALVGARREELALVDPAPRVPQPRAAGRDPLAGVVPRPGTGAVRVAEDHVPGGDAGARERLAHGPQRRAAQSG